MPQPAAKADPCDCGQQSKKKKKPKKKKPRTMCFGGSYIENTKGTRKTKRTIVDCRTGEEIAKYHKATAPRKPKGGWGTTPTTWETSSNLLGV